jgi:transposase-like protein
LKGFVPFDQGVLQMPKRKRMVENEEFWRSIMDQQVESGQSIRAFCRGHGIPEGTFFAWRKRLRNSSRKHADKMRDNGQRLVPVELVTDAGAAEQPTAAMTGRLEIITPGGCTLRFDRSIEPDRLRDVLGSVLGVERRVASC